MGRVRDGRRSKGPDTSLGAILHQHLRFEMPYVLEDWL